MGHGNVAITFITRTAPESLPRRGDTTSLPLSLNALFLYSTAGTVETKLDWPTASDRSRITPVQGGGFVVVTPDLLIRYSPEFKRLKELPLYLSREAELVSFTLGASPAGKYMLISYELPNGLQERHKVIDLLNLRIVEQWEFLDLDRRWVAGISDQGMSINGVWGGASSLGVPGSIPTDSPCPSTNPGCLRGTFVNDDTLFSWAPPNRSRGRGPELRLMRTNARVVLIQELPLGEVIHPFYPVVGGGRFALAIYKGHGGSESFDIAPHFILNEIRVYDSQTGQEVDSLDGKSQKIKSISAFALSADGALLGLIDHDGILRVYQLP